MKILLDMNIPLVYASLLIDKGFEAILWSEVGTPTATDAEIMAYARENDLIILTYDLDFGAILSVTHDLKPSIAQIRASILYAEKAVDLIATALEQNVEALKKGAILSADAKKLRVRLLPL